MILFFEMVSNLTWRRHVKPAGRHKKAIKSKPAYIQTRSSVPPKNPIYYLKVDSVGSCRFQIDLYILACVMSPKFTCEAVKKFLPAPFSWIWCKCLLRNLIHSKIFNLTKYRVLIKYSLLITHAEMLLWIWHQLRERLMHSFFK